VSSFTRNTFAAPASLSIPSAINGGNMPWISSDSTTLPGISVDGEKVATPIRPLGREIFYSSIELERSQSTQQPIDLQKLTAMNTSYQMNTDQMVYIGSTEVNAFGLVNNPSITVANVAATGTGNTTQWANKTPVQILADVNTLITNAWLATGYAICPSELRLPPAQFAYLASQLISQAGSVSILKFLQDNSISLAQNGRPLNIQPLKWLSGRGVSGTDRMFVYTNDLDRVRFPMIPIQRQTAYYQGIKYFAPYIWAYASVEFVYPETVSYADGI
jgi:hypothetical protein